MNHTYGFSTPRQRVHKGYKSKITHLPGSLDRGQNSMAGWQFYGSGNETEAKKNVSQQIQNQKVDPMSNPP